jgi:hypothetical protein
MAHTNGSSVEELQLLKPCQIIKWFYKSIVPAGGILDSWLVLGEAVINQASKDGLVN